MNPFLNPLKSYPFLKNLILDPNRIFKKSPEQIKKYQDKCFRKVVKYAYTCPVYHKKYKKAGIHPRDIKGIDDIKKLPFISKDEIRKGFPIDIIPLGTNMKKVYPICTGGTTGKPIFIYTDFKALSKIMPLAIRDLKYFDLSIKNAKIADLGNFSSNRLDLIRETVFTSHLKKFFGNKNALNVDVNNPIKKIVTELDKFQPDIIYSYPALFQHLAFLKKRGYAKNLNPKVLLVSGAILDSYTKSYVENAFKCKLLNYYSSVEASGEIAVECSHNSWHINHDYYYLEAIDKNNNVLENGKLGHLVFSKLFTGGTPIIRYTGMDDWIEINSFKKCKCGALTPVIEKLDGRKRANILLPNGKIFPPGAFCFIGPVLKKLNTFKIKQYQVIQRSINEIEILLVIDQELRNIKPSFKTIAQHIKNTYREKTGPNVNIKVKEVDEIINTKNKGKPAPIVLSFVDSKKAYDLF